MIIYVNYAMLLFNYFDLSLTQTQEEIKYVCILMNKTKKLILLHFFNKTIKRDIKNIRIYNK